MSNLLLLAAISCTFFYVAFTAETEQAKYIKRGKLKPRPGGLKSSRSVQMTYPNSMFSSDIDWKIPAAVDESLVRIMKRKKTWKDISWSQHDEDMWLLENWFYGMKGGVIIESGALDGILFSNSNLFESFMNWTAILIG